MPGKKKSTGKAVNSSKSISVASHVVPTKSGSPSENSLSATLERLAEQTRQTVGNIDAAPESNIAGDEMENLVRQFEELGGSQVLAKPLAFALSICTKHPLFSKDNVKVDNLTQMDCQSVTCEI